MRVALGAGLLAFTTSVAVAQQAALPSMRPDATHASRWSGPWVGAMVGASVLPLAANSLTGTPSSNSAFVMGGGQAGFDLQWGSFVFGVTGALVAHSHRRSGPAFEFGARAGYLLTPAALLFATGGLSAVHNRLFVELPGILPSPSRVDLAQRLTSGFYVGAGIEYRLSSSWSVAGEYIYSDSGSVAFKGTFVANGFADQFDGAQALRMQSLRFSVRHRF